MDSLLKEINVNDLNGINLDFAMSKIYEVNIAKFSNQDFIKTWQKGEFRYSSDYSLTGELIELEKVQSSYFEENSDNKKWVHTLYVAGKKPITSFGDTFLNSFCRCIVKAKVGDTVSIPKDLF